MKITTTDAGFWRGRIVAALLLAGSFLLFAQSAHALNPNIPRATVKTLFPENKPADAPAKNLTPAKDEPVSIEADSMGYDKDKQIAVAIGHVVVVQGSYVLNADRLVYYQGNDRIEAMGNVSVLQPTGDVYFADHVELHDSLKRGTAYAFKMRMVDNSVMTANKAHKVSEAVTVLDHAVYSPCHICENMAPFWQIESGDMKMDQQAEKITYHDAQMQMFGIPVFYSPYLRQPTPNAAAQSGLLAPTYTASTNLGTGVKAPYYWRIADDKDVIITPWFLSTDSPILLGDYRQKTDYGSYDIKFSATDPQKRDSAGNAVSGNEFRGNIDAQGVENLSDYSRIGFDINHASDGTYLARYGLGDEQVLFSRLYAETAQQRNFASVEGLAIQGLRVTDNAKTTPFVAPIIDGYYETEPLDSGLRFHFSGNTQSLTREIGADQRRVSVTAGATYPYVTDNGQVLNASANLRQDLYSLDNVTVAGTTSEYNGTQARSIPQTALQWRYPLIRASDGDALTIEPIVLGVAQPDGGNIAKIDNEDSQVLELSDTNLFDIDRVPGYDVVDSGARLAYGFRTEYMLQGGEILDGLLGQNYSFDGNAPFPNSSTPGKNVSDIIGRAGLTVQPISVTYRFALNESDLNPNRSQLSVAFAKPWLTLSASYNSVAQSELAPSSKELDLNGKLPLTDEWSLYGSAVRDLELDRWTTAGTGLIYHNECFDLTLDGLRSYTHDRDVAANTSVTFRVGFKNLGVFGG